MGSLVEQELWRIFTFYSLHSDPTLPEQLKVPSFIRFAKDCQILSSKLKGAIIELEIARVARARRVVDGGDYNPSTALSFLEFLNILALLSQKIYSQDPPEVAIRRILLENVLLLASRRVPFVLGSDINSPEALKVVRETCSRPLLNIFNHYVLVAESRRNQMAGTEVLRRYKEKEAAAITTVSSPPPSSSAASARYRQQMQAQKDLIGYREYIQFCHDFSLRSTALLTAIQVGEIFLNCVALDPDTKSLKGMNFETFCTSLIHMSAVAYRDADPTIPLENKVKALLLFMWKHVNNREKTAEVARSRVRVLISSAGSLNLYGSGLFSDFFLTMWQAEGFPTYTEPAKQEGPEKGSQFLRKVTLSKSSSRQPPRDEEGGGEGTGGEDSRDHGVGSQTRTQSAPRGPIVLHGYQLAHLFKKRPELAEFIYLEIENFRQGDGRP